MDADDDVEAWRWGLLWHAFLCLPPSVFSTAATATVAAAAAAAAWEGWSRCGTKAGHGCHGVGMWTRSTSSSCCHMLYSSTALTCLPKFGIVLPADALHLRKLTISECRRCGKWKIFIIQFALCQTVNHQLLFSQMLSFYQWWNSLYLRQTKSERV